jgi:hypothetical protein
MTTYRAQPKTHRHVERGDDFYATPSEAVQALLSVYQPPHQRRCRRMSLCSALAGKLRPRSRVACLHLAPDAPVGSVPWYRAASLKSAHTQE